MKKAAFLAGAALLTIACACVVVLTSEVPPIDSIQRGYRGLGMVEMVNPRVFEATVAANQLPEVTPPLPPSGKKASEVYQNVKVLGDVDADELTRLMTDLTNWVAPDQGCAYCHAEGEDLSSDKLYTKVVSRRMIEMTRHINATWKPHVADTGVTCYTCHRGLNVPANVWFKSPVQPANSSAQNLPVEAVGLTSLPYDPFTPFLQEDNDIRVVSTSALPAGNTRSIKQTEWTYALMMNLSKSLGVNCTFCHNSRSFSAWDQSTPQRATSWHGIRMVRDLNAHYLEGLKATFPPHRLGPLGDVPKVNCGTCHQGAYKPLFGASMLKDYPELAGPDPAPAAVPPPPPRQ
jgi:photosynthetic reaction center cytochrome c subunit